MFGRVRFGLLSLIATEGKCVKKWRPFLTARNPQQKSGTVLICGYTIVVLD